VSFFGGDWPVNTHSQIIDCVENMNISTITSKIHEYYSRLDSCQEILQPIKGILIFLFNLRVTVNHEAKPLEEELTEPRLLLKITVKGYSIIINLYNLL
jgi:hypothetical protein